ncbi:MAG TPA: hypothetical protein VMF91_07530 [Bryobacteraceae bacterium]|nr:hypothetical protein [Bryobacteraceae bacterium]
MALFGFGKKKSEERWHAAQLKANELSVKAADSQRHAESTLNAARREGDKERSAEFGGNGDAAARAREKRVDLERKGDALRSEEKKFEAGAKKEHDKAQREEAKVQSATHKLDLATAHIAGSEKAPLPGSVSERKQRLEQSEARELHNRPLSDEVKTQARLAANSGLLYEATQHRVADKGYADSAEDSTSDGSPRAQRSMGRNKDVAQSAGSPTTPEKEATALEGKVNLDTSDRQSAATPRDKNAEKSAPLPQRKGRSGWDR